MPHSKKTRKIPGTPGKPRRLSRHPLAPTRKRPRSERAAKKSVDKHVANLPHHAIRDERAHQQSELVEGTLRKVGKEHGTLPCLTEPLQANAKGFRKLQRMLLSSQG